MFSSLVIYAEGASRTTYHLGRLAAYDDHRWFFFGLIAVVSLVAAFAWNMIRRDAVELRPAIRIGLVVLRSIALAGLIVVFLDPQRRTEQTAIENSRVVLLVDQSQSMGLVDNESSGVPAGPSRIKLVTDALADGSLLRELTQVHDVTVVGFDQQLRRLALVKKTSPGNVPTHEPPAEPVPANQDETPPSTGPQPVAWDELLVPQGTETRLGDALKKTIHDQRDQAIAGMIVVTDGGQNAGAQPASAIQLAQDAQIPIHTIGLGSNRQHASVTISDVVAPARAYPQDQFTVTGYVRSHGMSGRTVTVDMYRQASADAPGVLAASRRVILGGDGEVVPVRFELTAGQPERRTYELRVTAPPEDRNAQDNSQQIDIDIVSRKLRVLLIASGPSREYRFLLRQLYRDKDVVVDVYLQSAPAGISQEANEILDGFPVDKQTLFLYDAIVAFDPDWTLLDAVQVEQLEAWVAEQAGGLIVLAGPIHTGRWAERPELAKITDLYPVQFYRRLSILDNPLSGAESAWPLHWTREGRQAEFLWIGEDADGSESAWAGFPGVYAHHPVKGAKTGAIVYAQHGDPDAQLADQQPVYMAGQFYGAGKVFYLGSGEMWRLRALKEGHFETLYTKLIRHVSQGRLLRGSTHGTLLLDRDRYLLGDLVQVRAQLLDLAYEPLTAPNVALQVTRPDGTEEVVLLKQDTTREGMYTGQLTAEMEGAYRLDLPLPDVVDAQLSRRIRVRVPDLERENPLRNDALLSEIASRTGGTYYIGLPAALGEKGLIPVTARLRDQTRVTSVTGAPDRTFEENLMYAALWIVAGALCLEWLTRRLCRLA